MRCLSVVVIALIISVFAGSTSAATLDFTDSLGSVIASGNDGTVTYSGNAAFGDVSITASPEGSDLTWTQGNGLGIDCPSGVRGCFIDSPYQIDPREVLTIQFERSVFLTSVDIAMLNTTGIYFLQIDEKGSVNTGGTQIDFDSDDAENGTLNVDINQWVSVIHLVPEWGAGNDFTLARLQIDEFRVPPAPDGGPYSNPIPEPSSVLLMLVGAGIVATQVRKLI
jgi:hypothetical protein